MVPWIGVMALSNSKDQVSRKQLVEKVEDSGQINGDDVVGRIPAQCEALIDDAAGGWRKLSSCGIRRRGSV